jgi:hypothetical protein
MSRSARDDRRETNEHDVGEHEIAAQHLKTRSLFKPLLVGALMIFLPLTAISALFSPFSGVTVNGEVVEGWAALGYTVVMLPLGALIVAVDTWLVASLLLWLYSKWDTVRIRYVPKQDEQQQDTPQQDT